MNNELQALALQLCGLEGGLTQVNIAQMMQTLQCLGVLMVRDKEGRIVDVLLRSGMRKIQDSSPISHHKSELWVNMETGIAYIAEPGEPVLKYIPLSGWVQTGWTRDRMRNNCAVFERMAVWED